MCYLSLVNFFKLLLSLLFSKCLLFGSYSVEKARKGEETKKEVLLSDEF